MATNLLEIFTKQIKIESKVRSIQGVFFNEDNLRLTDYCPSYQRNYVWDDEKATYFIESIFLGTELPPLIYFKSEKDEEIHNEIVDGRQRYQTILRFVQGELRLKKNGLQRLSSVTKLIGKSYLELDEEYRTIFEETKIRVIEYSFLVEHSPEDEDSVKKEIFQRYNSGITPLKNDEIDAAEYYHNDFNSYLKSIFRDDKEFDAIFSRVFRLSSQKTSVDKKVMKLRTLLVQHKIPIKYYSTEKQKVINKYFELLSNNISEDDYEEIYKSCYNKLKILSKIERRLEISGINYNRLYAECFYWAISVVEEETDTKLYDLKEQFFSDVVLFAKVNEDKFTTNRSSFAKVLVERYQCTAVFFEQEFNCSFSLFINNHDEFKKANRKRESSYHDEGLLSFEDLRINKPEPTSVDVVELLRNVSGNRFLIRPPYQRNEVKNKKKSSSIIESLLLGIKLPPIFVFKREDGISEVIDGQQRLLSILAFMGEPYKDENGKEQYSIQNQFSLDLRENGILKNLHGKQFVMLTKTEQTKIKSADIWVIEINGRINKNFDPVDLFIRLNNKPYPIAKDSFEMWNSFAPRQLINTIKDANNNNAKWFYLRKNSTRMENENIFTTLAYCQYIFQKSGIHFNEVAPEQTLELYKTDKRINCRFCFRYKITELMEHGDSQDLIKAVNSLEFGFVRNVRTLLGDEKLPVTQLVQSLDELLNFENGRRTQMMFYVLWILLHDLSYKDLNNKRKLARTQISNLISLMSCCDNLDIFKERINDFRLQFKSKNKLLSFRIADVAELISFKPSLEPQNVQLLMTTLCGYEERITIRYIDSSTAIREKYIGIRVNREGIDPQYIQGVLHSSAYIQDNSCIYTASKVGSIQIPFVDISVHSQIKKIVQYIDYSHELEKKYFERILDLMVYEIVTESDIDKTHLGILDLVQEIPMIEHTDYNNVSLLVYNVYNVLIKQESKMSLSLLKAVDMNIDTILHNALINEKNN